MSPDESATTWRPTESFVTLGLATGDITPPVGIKAHNWGAASRTDSTGVHRRLQAGAIAIESSPGAWNYVLTADLGWWRSMATFSQVFDPLVQSLAVSRDSVLLHLVHTHSGPSLDGEHSLDAGSELVSAYREELVDRLWAIAQEAHDAARPVTMTWAYGQCELAVNRDLVIDGSNLVAFNPVEDADRTLLVGRIEDAQGICGVIVNYACHPTTLGPENSLLSPDFVGAARSTVERALDVPCLFFQGASGELSPREQYSSDVALADRHGETLGYAALSVLHNMGTPGTQLMLERAIESGSPLGLWNERPARPSSLVETRRVTVDLDCRPALSAEEAQLRWPGIDPRATRERIQRASSLADGYVIDGLARHPLWVWRLGDAVIVAHPGEAYSSLQVELRDRYPDLAVIVLNLTNGPGFVYLPDEAAFDRNGYQVWQSIVARGSLARLIDTQTRPLPKPRVLGPHRDVSGRSHRRRIRHRTGDCRGPRQGRLPHHDYRCE